MAVGGVVVAIDGEEALCCDAYGVRWDKDDGLLFIGIFVTRVGFTHHDVDLAPRVASTTAPPFLFLPVQRYLSLEEKYRTEPLMM